MSNRKSEDKSEIWLKYCVECVKSKLENNDEQFLDSSNNEQIKKVKSLTYSK